MSDEPLTVEQVAEAIGGSRYTIDDDGLAHCPLCQPILTSPDRTLHARQNGRGAVLTPHCEHSSEAIEAVLQDRATRSRKTGDPLAQLRSKLDDLPIERVVKRGAGDSYELHLSGARIVELGNAEQLFSRRKFEAAVLGQGGHVLSAAKAGEHRDVVELVEKAAEHADAVTGSEETLSWLAAFLRYTHISPTRFDLANAADKWEIVSAPDGGLGAFNTSDGRLGVRLPQLAAYVNRNALARVTERELSMRLGRLGFTKPDHGGQIAARPPSGGKPRSGRYWISPPNFEVNG